MADQVLPQIKGRIEVIDVLRGFALLGIILAHLYMNYLASAIPEEFIDFNIHSSLDLWVNRVSNALFNGKFFTIFSFLFGLSFSIMLTSAHKKGLKFGKTFKWRLVLLFLIGFLHHIHFQGDILIVYALLGFLLIPFHSISDKKLLIWGLILAFNVPGILLRTLQFVVVSLTVEDVNAVANDPENNPFALVFYNYFINVMEGNYLEIIKHNLTFGLIGKVAFQIFSGRLFVTLGLFLLGMLAGRVGYFQNPDRYLGLTKKLFRWGMLIGIPTTISLIFYTFQELNTPDLKGYLGGLSTDFSNFFLTAGMMSGIVLLYRRNAARKILRWLAPVGKMGLTTYIMQTVFGLLVFYGYGLGQLVVIGNSMSVIIGILFFGFQIIYSKLWLTYFNNGPLEWLWRSGTYLKWQPMLKQKETQPEIHTG